MDLTTTLGPVTLRSPLIAASGTVGSVVEFDEVTDWSRYGAAVAKSVSPVPWPGRPAPWISSAGVGMLNGIGIQNPGVERWVDEYVAQFGALDVPVWGSAVGHSTEDFVAVAVAMAEAGIPVIEINLSCPNLDGQMFALDPKMSAEVVRAVRENVPVPIGAKLSPNSESIGAVVWACADAGADWVVLTNTVWGTRIDIETRRPVLSGTVGGYSGAPLKPIAIRCLIEATRSVPDIPIIGCGGVATAEDVVEYLIAGASAVAIGTAHFADPRVATTISRKLPNLMRRLGVKSVGELVGTMRPW
jgi:dihydroorotate dehydrogenase (NAD+) catalytic subunit